MPRAPFELFERTQYSSNSCEDRFVHSISVTFGGLKCICPDGKAVKVSAVASDGEFWVSKVLNTIATLESDNKHVSTLTEVSEEDQQLRKKAQNIVKKLRAVNPL